MKPTPMALSIIAGICFVLAFMNPLVCNDFSLSEVPHVNEPEAWIDDPCGKVTDIFHEQVVEHVEDFLYNGKVGRVIDKIEWALPGDFRQALISWIDGESFWNKNEELCEDLDLDEWARGRIYGNMDTLLGEVRDPRNGDNLEWETCMAMVEDGADSKDLGSCCSNEGEQR